jgi:S-DNA-T family DNA segregation ATPase FtsK/SpoIIIE
VTSGIDSRTILDTGGAQQLIGRGDMLISLAGKDMVRLQCALIETAEIDRLVKFIGDQRGYPEGFELPEYLDENEEPNKDFDAKHKDEYFNDAARLVVASQFGSTSLLQRKLQLGYNRAGRIIDQLEAAGIVGPSNGSKPRDVLVHDEATLEELLRSL